MPSRSTGWCISSWIAGTRELAGLPPPLRDGRVLSAVYRVGPCEPTTGTPSGYALRLLVEPSRVRVDVSSPIETLHLERAHLFNVSDLGLDLSARPDDLGIRNVADGAVPNSFNL